MKKQILSFIFLVTIVSTSVYGVSSKKYQPVFPLGEFSRPSGINPILSFDPTSVFFRPMKNALIRREENDAFNPGAVVKNGKVYIFYRTEDNPAVGLGKRTSRVALAESYDGRFLENWSKSASILTTLKNDQLVIKKVDGKYFMYWGEFIIYGATSTDLLNWTSVQDDKNELKVLMASRKGCFDSDLTECEPPAIWTQKGIILLYNGKNKAGEGDVKLCRKYN